MTSFNIIDDNGIDDFQHSSIPDSKRRSNCDASSRVESSPPPPSYEKKEQQEQQQSNSIVAVVVDDPCWGGPDATQHSLEHLLTIINKEKNGHSSSGSNRNHHHHHHHYRDDIDNRCVPAHKLVLHECSSYIALYKPPDLRMDGPYPATVHKLLTFWYPPPSIRCRDNDNNTNINNNEASLTSLNNNDDDDDDDYDYDSLLLSRIHPLSKHNDLPDNELRPCHQLDYATSGVLLVARSHEAASDACRAFQQRRVSKEYVALVYGHVNVDELETVSRERLEFFWQEMTTTTTGGMVERVYKRGRRRRQRQQQQRRRGDETFVGYLPSHSVFAKWKSRHNFRRKVSTKQQQVVKEENDDYGEILTLPPSITIEEMNAILKINWSDIKQNHPHWKTIFDDMAYRYNTAVKKNQQDVVQKQKTDDNNNNNTGTAATTTTASPSRAGSSHFPPPPPPPLPHLFRVTNDPPDTFYINAPLASLPHCFQMTLEPHVIDKYLAAAADDDDAATTTTTPNYYRSFLDGCDDIDTLDFKPALTRVTVTWRGYCLLQNTRRRVVVSKVILYPHTGRRHQLRCHMLLAGHVIVGDVAYEPPSLSSSSSSSPDDDDDEEGMMMNRMCLHAKQLTLVIKKNKNDDKQIITKTTISDEEGTTAKEEQQQSRLMFTAPDPFRVNEESSYVEIVGPEEWGRCDDDV